MKSFIFVLSIFLSSTLFALPEKQSGCAGSACCEVKKADCCTSSCTIAKTQTSDSCCKEGSSCCASSACCEKDKQDGKLKCSPKEHPKEIG